MKLQRFESNFLSRTGGELSLSGQSLVELLRAVFDRSMPFRFQAKGFSMSPFIRNGDVVTVSPLTDVPLRRTDMVAYFRPQTRRLIIHRVVGKIGNSYIMKGDKIPDADGLIPEANILGRVTSVHRNNKKIFLSTVPGWLLTACLAHRRILFPFVLPVWRLARSIIRGSRCYD